MANSLGAKDWRWIKTGKAERERETESARREGLHFITIYIYRGKRYGLRTTIQEQIQEGKSALNLFLGFHVS